MPINLNRSGQAKPVPLPQLQQLALDLDGAAVQVEQDFVGRREVGVDLSEVALVRARLGLAKELADKGCKAALLVLRRSALGALGGVLGGALLRDQCAAAERKLFLLLAQLGERDFALGFGGRVGVDFCSYDRNKSGGGELQGACS